MGKNIGDKMLDPYTSQGQTYICKLKVIVRLHNLEAWVALVKFTFHIFFAFVFCSV